jgi:hypothetical protein
MHRSLLPLVVALLVLPGLPRLSGSPGKKVEIQDVRRGRVEGGKAYLAYFGSLALEYPSGHDAATPVRVFVRPHDLEVSPERRDGSLGSPARVRSINPAGATVTLDVAGEDGEPIEVEVAPERFRDLRIGVGSRVIVGVGPPVSSAEGR